MSARPGDNQMNDERLLDIFRTVQLTRRFEERIIALSMAGEIPATLHPGRGQEIEQVAAISALGDNDYVLYGHRGIAYMVARGMQLDRILADIANKEGATSRGKGGVMHVVDVDHGILGESGTLGGGFVISVGVGMALKHKKKGQVVSHFFGDGTSNRGTFHESLNWAAVQKLPCIYVCENNGWAVSVPSTASCAVENIADRAAGYGIPGVVVDGNDPFAVREAMMAAVERARAGEGPTLIEAKVRRLLGHFIGDQQPYRADAASVGAEDPLPGFEAMMRERGLIDDARLAAMHGELDAQIEAAVDTVKAAPPLAAALAFEDLYA